MIDRLPELKKFTGNQIESTSDNEFNVSNNYQEEDGQGIDEEFFQLIKSVRAMIMKLNGNNQKIQSLKSKYGKAIKATQESEISQEMNEILTENGDLQKRIKKNIEVLKKEVEKAEKEVPDEPETRMKKNYYHSLTKEARDVLQKQHSFEDEFKNTVKGKISRQVRLIDQNLDEEEVEQYVDNPDLAQKMLEKKIYGQAGASLKNAVSDIQDKFRDIKKLEASVNQCVDLFQELAHLVYAQGQKIDSIEAHVADSKNYVEKGEKKLKQAKQHHKCSKKCMCIMIIVSLIVLIIIVVVVVSSSSNNNNTN